MLVDLIKRYQPAPKSERWEDYFHGREELLWSASPVATMNWTWGMVGLSLFGLPFLTMGSVVMGLGIIAIFSAASPSEFGMGLFFFAFSLPFVAVGVALTIGTWLASSLKPQFIRYALSNKRAYVASSWWSHKMESYPISQDSQIELQQGKSDTVYFATMTGRDSDGDKTTTRIGFEHIADGAAVYALLRDLQLEAKT